MTMNADMEMASITIGAILKAMRLMGCVDIPDDAKALFAEVNHGVISIHYITESPKYTRRDGDHPYCVISLDAHSVEPSLFTYSKVEEKRELR